MFRVVVGLSVVFVLIRLPFRTAFPVNWDAANFALGTISFSLQQHQPHPPGYIGFVFLGRLLNGLTGDPNASLTLLAALAGGLAPALFYLLAHEFLPRRHALAAALMFGLSPLLWYYSEVALTYTLEAALTPPIVLAAYRARVGRSDRALLVAGGLLAVMGATRQTALVLLLPMWLYAALALPRSTRWAGLAVITSLSLVWLIPLMVLSGGPARYLEESLMLARLMADRTSLLSRNLIGIGANVGFVSVGTLLAVHVGLAAIVLAHRRGLHPWQLLSAEERLFFLLWLAPALGTYLLIHTGQFGYNLLLVPIWFLWAGAALWRLEVTSSARSARPLLGAILALFLVASLAGFFGAPRAAYAFARADGLGLLHTATQAAHQDDPAALERARQYDLVASDTHWRELLQVVRAYDPETSVVLTTPTGAGSFRHLALYLPDHRVHGLGQDHRGRFGHLFAAYGGASGYRARALDWASPALLLSPKARFLLVPDLDVAERLPRRGARWIHHLSDGSDVLVLPIPPGSAIVIRNDRLEIISGDELNGRGCPSAGDCRP